MLDRSSSAIGRRRLLAALALAAEGLRTVRARAAARPTQTLAVSLPAAEKGWLAAVLYQARREQAEGMKRRQGLAISFSAAANAAEQQAEIFGWIRANRLDAIVVYPFERGNLTPTLAAAQAKGVFVTVAGQMLDDPALPDLFVGIDQAAVGGLGGAYMRRALRGSGQIVLLRALPGAAETERVGAFAQALEGSEIRALDAPELACEVAQAETAMAKILGRFPRIDAVWAEGDPLAEGALRAIAAAKRHDVRLVLGMGGSQAMLARLDQGDPLVPAEIIVPARLVALAMRLTTAWLVDRLAVRGRYELAPLLIGKDEAASYLDPASPY